MKLPSRRMPKLIRSKLGWPVTILLMAFLSAVPGAVIIGSGRPLSHAFVVSMGIFSAMLASALASHVRTKKIAAERQEENICSFARQLNCREVDTWIIRAVYEELTDYFGYPPHLEDSFDKIDPEDVDDMGIAISKRIGRPLNESEKNPYLGKVKTVRDMILFFTAQPLDKRPVVDTSVK